jgi:hypothetical protein
MNKAKSPEPINIPCKKAIYNSLADAEEMIKHITETRYTKTIKAYKCNICGFWHLTSKS